MAINGDINAGEIMICNTRSRKRKYDDLTNKSFKEDLEPKTHKDIVIQ